MDRKLRSEIITEVAAAVKVAMTGTDEVWLSEKELLRNFQMFTHDWIRRYGDTLPRTRAIVTLRDGRETHSSWAYARNKIQQMIMNNQIRQLKTDKI